ncbi:26S proteasome non-ATPase regulatory subunit 4 like protein [Verticillium longisporum]|uniref:26S proteasome non-ATPase regulatory subunit 4 like protein n=1 Tax=Verticillium longisporum TaxID=100787 RepID=A0A8I3ARZ8_VERLO|nr:26S proteasome non-ATPase regulatory subunit 4 like protein [Verticillium longisporum]
MVLEAVMVVVDNSESSRNGDYQPTRFDSQADAANVIFQTITNSNPESSVGLMSMGGKGPEVLVTLTTEQGKILEGLHRTKNKIKGSSHLATGIQVAGLALKHRQNKSQRQRIIVFVCSPIEEEEKKLVQLAKKMKKGNVSVDFVLFGAHDDDETQQKLQAFNENVKGGEGSHLVVIPPSAKLLSDQLISSPILLGEGAGNGGGSGGGGAGGGGDGGGDFDGLDFDPSMDPELALALRMSMEEEKARQEKKAREDAEAAQKASLDDIKEDGESAPLVGPAAGRGERQQRQEGQEGRR